jgi:hypothetical protein
LGLGFEFGPQRIKRFNLRVSIVHVGYYNGNFSCLKKGIVIEILFRIPIGKVDDLTACIDFFVENSIDYVKVELKEENMTSFESLDGTLRIVCGDYFKLTSNLLPGGHSITKWK